jgi:lipopolysaccharide export system protein LptC
MLARPTETTRDDESSSDQANPRDAAFRSARRHSRIVSVLKRVLPAVAIVMASAFLAQSYFAAPAPVDMKSEEAVSVIDGKRIMSNPKLEGFTRENRPYLMTAARAIQDVADERVVSLENIGAKLPVSADNWAIIDAATGVFDRDSNTLILNSAITVKTLDGMVAKLKSAHLDIGGGGLTTDQPVDISLNGTTITSDTMSVTDNGKVLTFEKRVRVNIEPKKARTALK